MHDSSQQGFSMVWLVQLGKLVVVVLNGGVGGVTSTGVLAPVAPPVAWVLVVCGGHNPLQPIELQ